jgi:hypothetical protein
MTAEESEAFLAFIRYYTVVDGGKASPSASELTNDHLPASQAN